MKKLFLPFVLTIVLVSTGFAQDLGKVIIRNASRTYPKFIVSLNGVRLSNDYNDLICFDFLDERNYKVKLLQAGSTIPLTFMVNNTPNYVTKYILNKDNAGHYSLVLESKVLAGSESDYSQQPFPEDAATPQVVTPMSESSYNSMLQSIRKENFENSKLEMAKTFFAPQNLSSMQVLGVLKLFSFEESRLDFAKFAYSRTVDRLNYYKVYDAFSFSGSKTEMSEYIKKNP